METITEYSCLGVSFLGTCSYDPNQPYIVYFDIGSAIAALGLTLAIQQLLKPIYLFRLASYGVQFWHLTLGVFVGFLCVIIASLLPNLPIVRSNIFSYPIFWEIIAGVIISTVYAISALLILRPTKIFNSNIVTFVRSAGSLLSQNSVEDQVKFAQDLNYNIESIFKYAAEWDIAEHVSAFVEFDRLKEKGERQSIQGRVPISPFYLFSHRAQLKRSWYACSLLRLMSDRKFCAVLISECPWTTAKILQTISEKNIYASQATGFIQQLAAQAIINNESMMTREIGYDGFNEAPLLSESLFSSPEILQKYRPFSKISIADLNEINPSFIERMNLGSKLMLMSALIHNDYWGCSYMFDVERGYRNLSQNIGWRTASLNDEVSLEVPWHSGIMDLVDLLNEKLIMENSRNYNSLFSVKKDAYETDLVSAVSRIVFESLSSISNEFEDYNGKYWHHSIGTFMNIFPFHENEIEGMSPLQQKLAIEIIKKLKENLDGYYPLLMKVIIAVVGPYENNRKVGKRTAYVIFVDAVYCELKKIKYLYEKHPEKVNNILPNNVSYDFEKNSLTHTFSLGDEQVTELGSLNITEVDLFDEKNLSIRKNKTDASLSA